MLAKASRFCLSATDELQLALSYECSRKYKLILICSRKYKLILICLTDISTSSAKTRRYKFSCYVSLTGAHVSKPLDLPDGWVSVQHQSGATAYLHKPSRVLTWSRPYTVSGSVTVKVTGNLAAFSLERWARCVLPLWISRSMEAWGEAVRS